MAPKIRADGANAWGSHGERSSGEVEETDASGRHRFSSANPYLQLPRPGTSVAGRVLGLAAACALVGAVPLGGGGDQDACRSPVNNIVAENCLPGAPSTEWDVNGAGDWSIQVGFHCSSTRLITHSSIHAHSVPALVSGHLCFSPLSPASSRLIPAAPCLYRGLRQTSRSWKATRRCFS
jgi:hypothetical protein